MQSHLRTIDIDATTWPDFPLPLIEGVGAQVGAMLFAGLGTAGAAWFSLDTASPIAAWRRLADFPNQSPTGAVAAAAGGRIYVFGGLISDNDGVSRQVDSIHCYEPENDRWVLLPGRSPVGLLGASAMTADPNNLWLFGGYNKQQFDDFNLACSLATTTDLDRINREYMSRGISDFRWNDHVWSYKVDVGHWVDLGRVPHWPSCKSGLITTGDLIYLVGGEVKPGLRSTTVKSATREGGSLVWHDEQALPMIEAARPQEGIAGAFTGLLDGIPVAAGGTHFPGAVRQYKEGNLYAHSGLNKSWRTEIYALHRGKWHLAGRLPQSRANGLAFQVGTGLLLVGGDTQDGRPCKCTLLLNAASE